MSIDDKASSGLKSVDSVLEKTSGNFEEAAAHASGFGGSMEASSIRTQSMADKIGNLSTKAAEYGHTVDRAMNLMDRYEITLLTIDNANSRVEASQKNLNEATQKYGAGSSQAEDAARQLEIAQNNLNKANIRGQSSMVMIGLSVLTMAPSFLTAAASVITFAASGTVMATASGLITGAFAAMSAGVWGLTAAILANPIGVAIILIIAAVVALKLAWDSNFGGIRQIAGAIFEFLEKHFKWLADAISWVIDKLSFLSGSNKDAAETTKQLDSSTGNLNTTMSTAASATGTLSLAQQYLAIQSNSATSEQGKLTQQIELAKLAVKEEQAAIDAGTGSYDRLNEASLKLEELQGRVAKSVDNTTLSLKNQSSAFDYLASKGIEASQKIVSAMEAAGMSIDAINASYDGIGGGTAPAGRKSLDELLAESAGMDMNAQRTFLSGHKIEWVDTGGGSGYWYDRRNINEMAHGGIVTSPTQILAGEAGPEAVIPLSKYNSGGFGNINITLNTGNIYGVDDLEAAIKNAFDSLKWRIRAAGG